MVRPLSNQQGQQVLEAILLMTVFLAMAMAMSQAFQKKQLLANMLSGPWDSVRGLTESGVWAPSAAARANHPNHIKRRNTVTGDEVK
jgi:hypothetical protein